MGRPLIFECRIVEQNILSDGFKTGELNIFCIEVTDGFVIQNKRDVFKNAFIAAFAFRFIIGISESNSNIRKIQTTSERSVFVFILILSKNKAFLARAVLNNRKRACTLHKLFRFSKLPVAAYYVHRELAAFIDREIARTRELASVVFGVAHIDVGTISNNHAATKRIACLTAQNSHVGAAPKFHGAGTRNGIIKGIVRPRQCKH